MVKDGKVIISDNCCPSCGSENILILAAQFGKGGRKKPRKKLCRSCTYVWQNRPRNGKKTPRRKDAPLEDGLFAFGN